MNTDSQANSVRSGSKVPDRGPASFAVSVATLTAASAFVVARLVSRYFIVRCVRWDDFIMILAWLIAVFLTFTIAFGTAHGLGQYDKDIRADQRSVLRRCEYVFSILYNPALMATKTSVLVFYLRLFRNTQFVLKYWSWTLLVIVNLSGTILTLINIFREIPWNTFSPLAHVPACAIAECSPVEAAWNPLYQGKIRCVPLLTEFICSSPINIITNLCLLFLPIPVLTQMRLPARQKIAVVCLFSLGIFITIVDVVRIYFLQSAVSDVPTSISSGANTTFGGQTDFAWNASLSFMWSAVEVNVGIICACIPTLKPLILKLLPAMLYDPDGSRSTLSKQREGDPTNSRTEQPVSSPPAVVLPDQPAHDVPEEPAWLRTQFITTPDMLASGGEGGDYQDAGGDLARVSTTGGSLAENAVYFGFVNMTKPKSMIKTSGAESFKYCSVVTILFLLWGLSYGLLNTLNNAVAGINDFSSAETLGLTSAYFGGGYLLGPLLVGEWILRRDEHNRSYRHKKNEMEHVGGFKVTFIVGLTIYGIGTIIFWPSAVTGSYGGFMVSNFIVGFGLSVLEVAANSFVFLCGPLAYGESRLLLAQAVQGTGSVLSGLLANKVFFTHIDHRGNNSSTTLINVQWTYLAITFLCTGLALFFYYMPLPEVGDKELEESAKTLPVDSQKRTPFFGLQLRTISLILAVVCQYLYVAAQESNSIYYRDLLIPILPTHADSGETATQRRSGLSVQDYLLLGHTAFAVSRYLFALLTYLAVSRPRLPRPHTLLTISLALSFLFSLLPVVVDTSRAYQVVIPIMLLFFAEGPVWPLIFAIGLRGQGRRTKRAAAFITMGGSGGGVVPFIMYGIIATGGSVQISYVVIIVLQVLMMAYPIFLEAARDARAMADPNESSSHAGSEGNGDGQRQNSPAMDEVIFNRMTTEHTQPPSSLERHSFRPRFLGKVVSKLPRSPKPRSKSSSPIAEVNHDEQQNSV
ncbi:transporter [Geosmithia morbida]|uniref:Transporter n=1 Tax=Geosmithia morbida TaxID=1094350 RepID=A0A9P4YQ20_9HYPO|nr:transporter [Geosmithia morbida]KAF4121028.1 transporter [Geosmithia morbida]